MLPIKLSGWVQSCISNDLRYEYKTGGQYQFVQNVFIVCNFQYKSQW